jgi:hypothetical protein
LLASRTPKRRGNCQSDRNQLTLSDLRGSAMSTITFDTHKFVKRLTEAGMPLNQAEILADEQTKLIDERLATKDDLEKLELRLIMKLGTVTVVAIGIMTTIMKLMH